MSLKKIAQLAGTSVSTVSRVLNQPEHRCHNKELSSKIWNIAMAENYVPNTYARNLRKKSGSDNAPFCVDIYLTRFSSMNDDSFFEELFQTIKEELLDAGCILGDVLNSADLLTLGNPTNISVHVPYKSRERIWSENQKNSLPFIEKKENTGLIVLGKCPQNLIPVLNKRYNYIAGIDRNPTEYEYDEIICNGATAAKKAVEHLISLGHTNIAYIGDCSYESRYIGYYQTLLNHHIPLNHTNVYPTNQTFSEGQQAMQQILEKKERPTAIFCANDMTALGVINVLHSSRKKDYLPSVIGIDNIKASERTTPMLTTIHIPQKEMAHLAVSLLLDRKNGKHTEHVRIELPCHLLKRESCYYYA